MVKRRFAFFFYFEREESKRLVCHSCATWFRSAAINLSILVELHAFMAKHENSWSLESGGGLCARQNNLLESELIGNAIDCFFFGGGVSFWTFLWEGNPFLFGTFWKLARQRQRLSNSPCVFRCRGRMCACWGSLARKVVAPSAGTWITAVSNQRGVWGGSTGSLTALGGC